MCQFVDWHTAPMGRFFYVYRKAGAVAMYFRLQRYPPPRLISYKIPRQGSTATDRVPVREVSTICTQRAGLVYCYPKFKNFQCLALPPASNPSPPVSSKA